MVKVIIAGGRDFNDANALLEAFDDFMKNYKNHKITVISGTARGADVLGEWVASQYGIPVEKYPADWNKYGKSAGYRRNEEMAKVATHLLAAWDGQSRGTNHMINLAKQYGLVIRILSY